MGTRAIIGAVRPDGAVKYVYCDMDGYLRWTGHQLLTHFPDRQDAERIMKVGDLKPLLLEECV